MISFIEMILNKLQNFLARFARQKVTIKIFHKIQLVFVYNLAFSNQTTALLTNDLLSAVVLYAPKLRP